MNLSKNEVICLLSDKDNEDELFKKADEIRKKFVGDEVYLRGLIEFSNICRNNCLYCGIRAANTKVTRYRMSKEEIIETARKAVNIGFKTIVMQSGEDIHFTKDLMSEIIREIKKFDVAVTLSIGERSFEEYKAWKDAGADRYLMRIETTDKNLYHKLNPDMSWQNRYDCLMAIKDLGYELGSGIMIGLPNQTIESIAEDLLFLQEIGVDMAGIGPFIPAPNTPLTNEKGGTLDLALRAMAIMRLLSEDINIPATTAMECLHPEGRIMALKCGANVIMPNVTDIEYKKLYNLYPNKAKTDNTQQYGDIEAKIIAIGRKIGTGYGGHCKKN